MELSNEFEVNVPIEQAWAVLTDLERIAPCLPGAQLQEVEGDDYRGIVKIKVGPISAQYKGTARFVEKDDVAHRALLSATGRDTRGQGNASASIVAELTAKGEATHVSVVTDLTITGKVAQFGRGVIGDVSVKLLDQFVENLHTTVLAGDHADDATEAPTPDADNADESAPRPADAAATEAAPAAGDDPGDTAQLLGAEVARVWEGEPEPVRADRPTLAPRPDLLLAEQDVTPAGGNGSGSGTAAVGSGGVRRIESAEAEPIDLLDAAGTPLIKRLVPVLAVVLVGLITIGLLRRRRRRS